MSSSTHICLQARAHTPVALTCCFDNSGKSHRTIFWWGSSWYSYLFQVRMKMWILNRKSIILLMEKSTSVSYFPTFILPSYFLRSRYYAAMSSVWSSHDTSPSLGILQQQSSWRGLRKAHRAVLQLYPIHHHHERNLCVNFAHRFDYV